MNVKRLNKLKTILATVPEEKFNLSFWYRENHLEVPADVIIPDNFEQIDCNTAACAVGWAAMDKGFQAEGFVRSNKTISYINNGCEWFGWGAVQRFFEISFREATYLFSHDRYKEVSRNAADIKPHHVIGHIEKLLNGENVQNA